MAAESPALQAVLEAIADGATSEEIIARSDRLVDDERRFLPYIELVAGIAEVHRTIQQDPEFEDPVAQRPALRPGDRWGNLELVERVGQGAFGEVWRAREVHVGADVALKLLHTGTREEAVTSRLVKEGRALAVLRHPHVVTVHGIETHDGHIGLRMEFVRGRTLEAILQAQGPFSAKEAAAVGLDLCRALAAVHRAGLVHRDIKAQNVMREEGGRIVLMDLGSGQFTSERAGGRLAGTPLYLAPEVIAGEEATIRTDIYSLGVLLYYLVTGAFPYKAATLRELADLHARNRPVLPQDARPDLSDAFARVVERALAQRPEDRFDSAGSMASALSQAAGETVNRRAWLWSWRSLAVAIPLVVVLVLAGVWWMRTATVKKGSAVPPWVVQRIAVLKFTTVGIDDDLELLSRGIPMEVTASLGQIGAIKVVPWSYMRQLQPGSPLQTVVDRTQADAIVEGTIQRGSSKDGSSLHVNVQVFRAGSGILLWTQDFETRSGGVIALQADIARRIAGGLRIALARREQNQLARFKDVPDEAVELYLKGREQYESYEENFSGAVDYFKKALKIDRDFADAHAALAECYAMQSTFTASSQAREAFVNVLEEANQAIRLNPELAEAYSARGFAKAFLKWDRSGAEADFKRALELGPHSAMVRGDYSNFLSMVDRHEEAIEQSRIAEERAPLSPVHARRVAWAYYMARRYHEAIEQLRRVLDMDPSHNPARTLLARSYAMVGWYDDAIREFEPIPKGFEAMAAQVYAQAGQRQHALDLLENAKLPHNYGNPRYQIAAAYVALDNRNQALYWLCVAFSLHEPGLVHLGHDPRFDALRGDPQFEAQVARLYHAQLESTTEDQNGEEKCKEGGSE